MSGAGNPKKAASRAQIASFWVSTPWACEEIKAIPRVGKGDQIRSSLLTGLAIGKLDPKLARLIGEFGGDITVEQLLMLLKVCFPDEPALRLVGNLNYDDVRSLADSMSKPAPDLAKNSDSSKESNFSHSPTAKHDVAVPKSDPLQPVESGTSNAPNEQSELSQPQAEDLDLLSEDAPNVEAPENKGAEPDKKGLKKGSDWTKSLAG